ncbi:MAG: tRNA (guanosine(37)-N1)-methyltransferase TrmD [Dehalococcoidia bacterium]|nr:MAG: tRNA (guanosine(37)-N1)-methyltransferase TrmD [Dehalococcoidia bacterium]
MRIDILTLFPQMFDGLFNYSIIGRARERHLVDIRLHNIRTYTHDKHHAVDDYPYGGGAGMVLKPEPVFEAAEAIKGELESPSVPVILLSPQGRLFNQEVARQLAGYQQLILICGHYEGVDERVVEHLANDEISVGDYLLSGGEVAAMVIVDCVVRLLPGVVGSEASLVEDSHTDGLLEYPQYTRPAVYRGWAVPSVLLSGNHSQIARWRRQQSLLRTAERRPDLLEKAILSKEDEKLMNEALRNQVVEGM